MCHASMGNHEIHRCKSCDDRWPHKISQHHFPAQTIIKNNTLYKNIVGTQLTALSLTDTSIPFCPPPRFHMDWEPPLDAMTPHEVELEAYTERLRRWTTPQWSWTPGHRGGSFARHPVWRLKKHVWEREKTCNFWWETNQRSKRTATCYVMSNHHRGRV